MNHTWINLKTVVTLVGVFKQAIHRVEYFMGKEKEPFSVDDKATTITINLPHHKKQQTHGNPTLQHHHNLSLLLL